MPVNFLNGASGSGNIVIKLEESGKYGPTCVIDRIEVSLRMTTATTSIAHTDLGVYSPPSVMLGLCGSGVGKGGCTQGFLFQFPSTPVSAATVGSVVGGSGCGSLVFDESETAVFSPYSSPAAPYTGRYRFVNDGRFDDWYLDSGLTLNNRSGGPSDMAVQCIRATLTTRTVAAP